MTIKLELPALQQVQQLASGNQAALQNDIETLLAQWYRLREHYEGDGAESTERLVMELRSWLEEYSNKLAEFETRIQHRLHALENLKAED